MNLADVVAFLLRLRVDAFAGAMTGHDEQKGSIWCVREQGWAASMLSRYEA